MHRIDIVTRPPLTRHSVARLHEEDGQAALQAAGLTERLRSIVHPGGQATCVLDRAGSVLFEQPADK